MHLVHPCRLRQSQASVSLFLLPLMRIFVCSEQGWEGAAGLGNGGQAESQGVWGGHVLCIYPLRLW